ncbi:MAG: SLBB domain-containing protein [Chlorobium sp.]|uniref:polysaccharide biosynthesis/export family protein n=1 Tax=Chlorobium sp. TaxID=1095 RepID=UPI0025BD48FE|nr:SLBB domain-containing protein [Chlorobium sp.]MCF8383442.1 SLBB domain-containing protein [Chlorobium sp.]
MKIVLKRIVSSILIIQVLLMPVMTIQAFAASPFDSAGSPIGSTPGTAAPAAVSGRDAAASISAYQTGGYFTDSYGNILMNVNVWGNVNRPGQVIVPEGADIALLISLAGGPREDANLKKIRINRAMPDENGKTTYQVNLDKYAKEGDRSMLLAMQPNDTVVVPKSNSLNLLGLLGVISLSASIYALLSD